MGLQRKARRRTKRIDPGRGCVRVAGPDDDHVSIGVLGQTRAHCLVLRFRRFDHQPGHTRFDGECFDDRPRGVGLARTSGAADEQVTVHAGEGYPPASGGALAPVENRADSDRGRLRAGIGSGLGRDVEVRTGHQADARQLPARRPGQNGQQVRGDQARRVYLPVELLFRARADVLALLHRGLVGLLEGAVVRGGDECVRKTADVDRRGHQPGDGACGRGIGRRDHQPCSP